MSRAQITKDLTTAAVGYFVKKRHAVFREIGLIKWGRRRADLITLTMYQLLTIVEVKSCLADFTSDKKWSEYREKADRMFFMVPPDIVNRVKAELLDSGVGIMTVSATTGFARVVKRARTSKISNRVRREVITRCAWHNGQNRTNTRRQRVWLPE
jgi:hypothetical protein